jgi:hypothetical protein
MRKDAVTPSKKTALPSQDPFVVVGRRRRSWSPSPSPPPPLDDDYDKIDGDGLWPLSSPSANDVTRGKGGIRRRRRRRRLRRGGRLGERALTSGASSGRSLPTSGGGSAVVIVRTGQRRAQGQQQRRGVGQRQRGWGRWTTEWAHNNQPSTGALKADRRRLSKQAQQGGLRHRRCCYRCRECTSNP